MAVDELGDQVGGHVVDVEPTLVARGLRGDPGVEQHLQQHVAEFLADRCPVTVFDRLGQLVGLLDQVPDQRLVSLLGVPRAAAGRP